MKYFNKHIIKKNYIGQCNTLRIISDENEKYWHDMMKDKKKISFNKFIKSVNCEKFLDNDETMKDYINNCYLSDNTTKTYISHWGNIECMFLQTSNVCFFKHVDLNLFLFNKLNLFNKPTIKYI